MQAHEHILLIRLKSIGDVVFTLPAVHAVRENFPRAKISFLTLKQNAPLLRGFAEVDNVIALDRAALRNPLAVPAELFRLLQQLRAEKFSLIVDFQGYGETAWLSWFGGAPERWGNVYGGGREWLYTRGIHRGEKIHFIEWNLSLLRQCGLNTGEIKNDFFLPGDTLATARKFFAENNLNPEKLTLFFLPFTSSPQKNWPLENYFAVAKHFQLQGAQIIFGGGPADRAALEQARRENFAVAAGAPLLVSAGLEKLSALVIGGDTGLLHLAVAMKKRVLMLMQEIHPGSPIPFQHPEWAMAPPIPGDISKISIAQVLAAVESAFNESAGNVFC